MRSFIGCLLARYIRPSIRDLRLLRGLSKVILVESSIAPYDWDMSPHSVCPIKDRCSAVHSWTRNLSLGVEKQLVLFFFHLVWLLSFWDGTEWEIVIDWEHVILRLGLSADANVV